MQHNNIELSTKTSEDRESRKKGDILDRPRLQIARARLPPADRGLGQLGGLFSSVSAFFLLYLHRGQADAHDGRGARAPPSSPGRGARGAHENQSRCGRPSYSLSGEGGEGERGHNVVRYRALFVVC